MFSVRRASPVFHFRHFQALSLNLIDGRYQCLSIKVGIHTLGERHGAGMPHDLLDHRLIYMSLRQHRDTCMPGVVRLMLESEALHKRRPVAVIIVAVLKVLVIRRMNQILAVRAFIPRLVVRG